MLKFNNFFNLRGDECTCEHVELPLIIVIGQGGTFNKTTKKYVNKKITHSRNDNVLSIIKIINSCAKNIN
jgi:hypothetical protein